MSIRREEVYKSRKEVDYRDAYKNSVSKKYLVYLGVYAIRQERWEFIKENKTVRKQENTLSTKKVFKKKEKENTLSTKKANKKNKNKIR